MTSVSTESYFQMSGKSAGLAHIWLPHLSASKAQSPVPSCEVTSVTIMWECWACHAQVQSLSQHVSVVLRKLLELLSDLGYSYRSSLAQSMMAVFELLVKLAVCGAGCRTSLLLGPLLGRQGPLGIVSLQ